MPDTTVEEIWAVRVVHEETDEEMSLRDWLKGLLLKLWEEKEDFSGKRPWGNSGWDNVIDIAMIQAGLVDGSLDDDGCVWAVDTEHVDYLVTKAIKPL